ncbi:MAG TPA: hypothetical protein VMS78_03845 [Rhizomicrobium sp.]|nr:hypothetical protein [Rhizomicrobium sp.]
MSELITLRPGLIDFRWQLLATVSALTLFTLTMSEAKAEDTDRPTVWIELGGQLSRWENSQQPYAPPFAALTPSNLSLPQAFQKPPRYGVDESAALTIQPDDSNWTFSAAIHYGRSGNSGHHRQQSNPASALYYVNIHSSRFGNYQHSTGTYPIVPIAARFTDVVSKQSESHAILDFQAGKDVGLGMFGRDASSTLNLGVRFAQFTSRSSVKIRENPDWQFKTHPMTYDLVTQVSGLPYTIYAKRVLQLQPFHSFAGTFLASRSFSGLGPSISWDSSEPVIGSPERGELSFDWGVNAALLFGRQKTKVQHHETNTYHSSYPTGGNQGQQYFNIVYQGPSVEHSRSRGVFVPNIGGFAGLSLKYPNAKVTLGYKADFFFGAMDGGNDVRRAEDIGFHGPYASISIGLGG